MSLQIYGSILGLFNILSIKLDGYGTTNKQAIKSLILEVCTSLLFIGSWLHLHRLVMEISKGPRMQNMNIK